MLGVGLVLIWRWRHLSVALLAAAAAAAVLLRHYWPLMERNFSLVYLLQEGGFYGLMALSFGQSLRERPRGAVHATRGQVAWPAHARKRCATRAASLSRGLCYSC